MASDSGPNPLRTAAESTTQPEDQFQRALEQIRIALRSIRFGQVTVTVQDGIIVQIDRTEKTRLR